ncbi:hypothetical protein [Bacillus velezensis]|uniref:hypothetical protein n=1 Tax=Bacillus velezensis TaxID=492670 RepID=UPI003EBF338F
MSATGQIGLGEMFFHTADLYPNTGFLTTKGSTVPEAADQNAMVDDTDMAEKADTRQNPVTSKQILLGFAIIFFTVFLFSARV